MKILSIDPGYERLGIAILEKEKKGAPEKHIFSETFQTSAKTDFTERLFLIGKRIEEVVKEYEPEALAIEKLFFNTNQKTATNVAETRGVILYIALKNKMSVSQYTPLEIKMALTGNGRSDKKQVIYMVKQLISIDKEIQYDDEYDAVAVGLTHFAYKKEY